MMIDLLHKMALPVRSFYSIWIYVRISPWLIFVSSGKDLMCTLTSTQEIRYILHPSFNLLISSSNLSLLLVRYCYSIDNRGWWFLWIHLGHSQGNHFPQLDIIKQSIDERFSLRLMISLLYNRYTFLTWLRLDSTEDPSSLYMGDTTKSKNYQPRLFR